MLRRACFILAALLTAAMVYATGQGETGKAGQVQGKIIAMINTSSSENLDKAYGAYFNKKYPNVQVEFVPAPNTSVDRRAKYVTMFAAKDGSIDVVLMNTVDTGEFASSGWILPLDRFFNVSEVRDRNSTAFFNACLWNGKLYGIPLTADTLDFYYRKDLLADAGLKAPAVWSELGQAALKLQTPDRFGFAASWERGNQIFCQFLLFVASNGGSVMSKDLTQVTIDSPENAEALQLMADAIAKQKIAPKDVLSLTTDNARIVFNEARAVFTLNWDYSWARFQQDTSKVKGKVGVGTPPSFPGKAQVSVIGGWNNGVNAFSKNQATAVEFIRTLSEDDMMRTQVLQFGQTTPNKKAMSDPEYVAKNPEFLKALANNYNVAVARPVTPAYAEITEAISQEVMPALYGEKSVKDSLAAAAKKITAVMK
jgi:multiple sugar transport system substrate-binding protein